MSISIFVKLKLLAGRAGLSAEFMKLGDFRSEPGRVFAIKQNGGAPLAFGRPAPPAFIESRASLKPAPGFPGASPAPLFQLSRFRQRRLHRVAGLKNAINPRRLDYLVREFRRHIG